MIDHEFKDAVRKCWDQLSEKYGSCSGHGIATEEEKTTGKHDPGPGGDNP